ncbi:MAG: hypothetical protein ABI680_17530 [Chthoniobacteraceae bacterium]
MPANRRRNANAVPLASIAAWILVCLFIGTAGLGYVWLKNDLHVNASKIKELETERQVLSTKYLAVRSHIITSSSMDAISRRYHTDKTKLDGLIEIPTERIVFVDRPKALSIENNAGFRKVAIQEGSRP